MKYLRQTNIIKEKKFVLLINLKTQREGRYQHLLGSRDGPLSCITSRWVALVESRMEASGHVTTQEARDVSWSQDQAFITILSQEQTRVPREIP
jgi:hypothetical protein